MDARKKTLNLDEDRIERVKRLLGVRTATDAIHGALDWVIQSQAAVDDLMSVAGKGKGLFRNRRRSARGRAPAR